MPLDLHDDEALRAACADVEREVATEGSYAKEWRVELASFLERVERAPESERRTHEFQQWLWDKNPVTSVGMGTVRVDEALADEEFRSWLSHVSLEPLPDDAATRTARLEKIHKEMLERLRPHTNRLPQLKALRVLAALFPNDFTTIADRARLRQVHDAICTPEHATAVARNVRIMQRLAQVLGPGAPNAVSRATRMTLPWMLYGLSASGNEEATAEATPTKGGEVRLRPLPAARRRKGLTAIGDTFQRMLAVLQEIEDGKTREDLLDYLRGAYPGSKTTSYGILINVLMSEFGVLFRDGNLYKLTPTGEAVLETGEADPLAEWLLTRVLGVDHVLVYLRDHGLTKSIDLLRVLQEANPGWTATRVPNAILTWLRAMDVIEKRDGELALSDRGDAWAQQIHWIPEVLDPDTIEAETESERGTEEELSAVAASMLKLPELDAITAFVRAQGVFSSETVRDLHAGLAAHHRRHMAVLAGLSGTGKTLLAKAYATALVGGEEAARTRLKIIAVQPGWYDPGALLGYPNPVKPDEYVRMAFLEFLFRAARDPGRPHVVILDEMNLSHPEQYMAPLLSAMETGGQIDLHAEGDELDGVPAALSYPSNLYILGTVNMDETTQGLSDKVLDRAFVLEFWKVDLDAYPKWGETGLSAVDETRVRRVLTSLLAALHPARLHFGWRVVDDVFGFLRHARVDGTDSLGGALDSVLYAKVMPKLRGEDGPRFRAALEAVRKVVAEEGLPRCRDKVDDLVRDLETTGSARFWR